MLASDVGNISKAIGITVMMQAEAPIALARPWSAATASSSLEATPRRRKSPGGDPLYEEGRI